MTAGANPHHFGDGRHGRTPPSEPNGRRHHTTTGGEGRVDYRRPAMRRPLLVLIVATLGAVPLLVGTSAHAAAPAPALFVVADSVGLSAKDAIPRAFPGWNVTVTGRPAVFTDVAVGDYVAPAGPLPAVAVVATGYNYPYWDPARFDRSVDAMVGALVAKGVRHVIWVTLREVKPQYISAGAWADVQPYYWYFPEVNQHLRAALGRHPELALADWAALADQPGLSYDAIHLNTTGAALYARLLRTEVDGIGRLPAGQTLEVAAAGTHGVPADAAAVVVNVTVDDPKYAGYVTVQPCGAPPPSASTLNYEWAATVANHVLVKPGTDGKVCVFTYAATHVIVDLLGWITAAGGYTGVAPVRVLDTRATSRLGAGATVVVRLDAAGVPAGADAVVVNVTAVDPAGPGYLSVSPCPGAAGPVSSVNYGTGQTVADLAVTPMAADGTICVQSYAPTHVLVDVMGWFAAGSPFTPVTPRRLVDTRSGTGPVAGGSALTVDLPAVGGVPAGAAGAALTVTLTGTKADGYATVYPCGQPAPLASDLNYRAGASVPALTVAALPADGKVCVTTSATADILVDLSGWVEAGPGYVGITPTRLVDTRAATATT